MGKREDREERKSRALPEMASSSKWITDNKKGGDKLPFPSPEGLPVVKLEKDKIYRWSFLPFITGKKNVNPSAAPGKMFWNRVYASHTRLGPNKESVLCLAHNYRENCPACQENEKIWKIQGPSEEQKELAKLLKHKKRIMALIYDHDAPQKGVQFFEDSFASFGDAFRNKIARYVGRPEFQKYDTHFNPKGGYIIHLGTTEKQIGSNGWTYVNDIEFHKRGEPLPLKIINQALEICLDDLIADNKPKSSYIKNLISPPDEEVETEEVDNEEEEVEEDDSEVDGEDGEGEDEEDADGDSEGYEELGEDDSFEPGDDVTLLVKGVRKRAKVLRVKDEKLKIKYKDGTIAVVLAEDVKKVEQEEEEEKPKKKPKPKPRTVEDEFEEDEDEQEGVSGSEDEDEDAEEEDEEEKPKRKPKPAAGKKPVKKPKDEEEDDDDFDF